MTREEAILTLCANVMVACERASFDSATCNLVEEALNMAIEALEQSQWIPVKWHEITDAEREENGYPKEWAVLLDCKTPSDDEKILVTTRYATVEADVCYEDGELSLDSGWDWVDDIVAWMPLPEPWKGDEEK